MAIRYSVLPRYNAIRKRWTFDKQRTEMNMANRSNPHATAGRKENTHQKIVVTVNRSSNDHHFKQRLKFATPEKRLFELPFSSLP
jgi:hypothetical protein